MIIRVLALFFITSCSHNHNYDEIRELYEITEKQHNLLMK